MTQCATQPRRQHNSVQISRTTSPANRWTARSAEKMLREMAFVYQITRSLKASMLAEENLACRN